MGQAQGDVVGHDHADFGSASRQNRSMGPKTSRGPNREFETPISFRPIMPVDLHQQSRPPEPSNFGSAPQQVTVL